MIAGPGQDPLVEGVLLEFGKCEHIEDLSVKLAGRPDLLRPAVVEQLTEAVRRYLRVNVDEALCLAEVALAIAKELSIAEALGRGFRAKANALWFKGNCKAAVELFEAAVAHFEQAGQPDEVGRTLSSCIQALALLGEYERATQAAAQAREIFLRLGDRWRLARLEINVANIHHRQDRFREAFSSYERAYQELLAYKDMEALGVALHNMAVCLIMLNEFDSALACYRSVRELCERNAMPLLAAQADYNIAYLYFLRGDYENAIERLRTTRQLCHSNGDPYHAALCDLDRAEIYVELNLTDEAARLARDAEQQFAKLGMPYETGRSVVNLAIATHHQNNSSLALEMFARARIIFAQENNRAGQALIDLYQALVLFECGNLEPARLLCRQALKVFEESKLDRRALLCRLLLARLSLDSGHAWEAAETCTVAMQKVAYLEAPLLTYQTHLLLGHAQRASGAWELAYQSYQKARFELETLRGSLQGEELKIAFVMNKLDVYESLVQFCLRKRSAIADEEAFHYMEQAKSRSLTESLFGRTGPGAWPRAEGREGDRLRALRAELNWYYHRIDIEQTRPEGISVERIARLRAEANSRENELLRAVRELPGVSELTGVPATAAALTLEQIRAALHPDATLVEYFQIGPQFVAAVLTRDDLKIVQLAPSSQVTACLRMLDFQFSKFRLKHSYARRFKEDLLAATENRLRALYQDLVAPLASALKGRRLIIVPHGVLHYLPFHALSSVSGYLIDRFAISFAPSASTYAICHRQSANSAGSSLLLGVHDKDAPWIRREINSVAAIVHKPNVFLGKRATGDVLRARGSTSRLIHIATHGSFRRDNPMFSSVRLADSYLTLYDLYQLKLPVELLTLSGCATGLNVVASGDELLGLTRGLLCAGAQTLLLTLWDVHDHTTAELMTSFYAHLEIEQDKGLALQAAMLELRQNYPHPYYWAPFILVGKAFPN